MFLIVFFISSLSVLCLDDTLRLDDIPIKANVDFSYYKLQIYGYKTKAVQYYQGFDKEALLRKKKSVDHLCKKIYFFENDSLIYSVGLSTDTNFAVLVSSINQPIGADTIRIFENRQTKKINPEDVFLAFKKLRPMKITIAENLNKISKNRFDKTVFLFKNKKVLTYFKASKIVLSDK
ncbi:MAG: hypothetical protein ACUVQ1_09135 [Candidatus Kapaibacteriales bacterium]